MKVYAIFANDNTKGTTHKIFSHALTALESVGHEIDILDLYSKEKDIPFFRHDRAYMESHPFYIENKERFLQADTLLIVFPLFWYSVPGILKTWLDMINGWAYKYESGLHAKPLHKIKKVMIFYSAMQDRKHLEDTLQNPVKQQLTETFKFIGIGDIETYIVDNVVTLSPTDLEKHLLEVAKICKN
jgi:NAD(P)H dehydrogenase (quinone)